MKFEANMSTSTGISEIDGVYIVALEQFSFDLICFILHMDHMQTSEF